MRALWRVFRRILHDQRGAMLRGAALSLVVLLSGIALLGLSGWFITAAAAAGLAGTGAVFDVFRPSALVRFLALGRTVSRYGERILTHDATLRVLAEMRGRLLSVAVHAPYDQLVRLRGPQVLNRLTADVDALDGVPLRLILPIGAGLAAQAATFALLWALVDLRVALWIGAGFVVGSGVTLFLTARAALAPSRGAEAAAQSFRAQLIDLIRARSDLAVFGQLARQSAAVLASDATHQKDRAALDQIERRAGFALSLLGTTVAAGALWLGMALAQGGTLTPAYAAIGFFTSLALMETVAPLRRAMADLGRMSQAAARVEDGLVAPQEPTGTTVGQAGDLHIKGLTFHRPGANKPVLDGVSLDLKAGENLALAGPSGVGKSTLLLLVAGLLTPASGQITLAGLPLPDWDETALRAQVMLVPQRSALMAGSVRDALLLATPQAGDADLWAALDAVALTQVIRSKGGLEFLLGPQGAGLSGGEARRLVLARALLRRPSLLLLDEPTEGLDGATARAVLAGIRAHLPRATILTASHRAAETDWAGRVLVLG